MTAHWTLVLAAVVAFAAASPLAPNRLRVEYMNNPRGMDVTTPRFSWALTHADRGQAQVSFEIEVVGSLSNEVVWFDNIETNRSNNVAYNGVALQADTAYTWRVRYTDVIGAISPWSANATFTMGLLTTADWSDAQWIGGNQLMRKDFTLDASKRVVQAFAYVVGLGYYKLHLDGRRVSDHELGPFTTFTRRVYYDTIDLTDHLQGSTSKHAIGVHLGNGWYSERSVNVGPNTLLMKLSIRYDDGTTATLVSDTGFQACQGPVINNDIYDGEWHDARLEQPGWDIAGFTSATCAAAKTLPPPANNVSITSHAVLPPIRIGESFTPCDFYQSAPNVWVFDFCQNMAGFTTLHVPEGLATSVINITQYHAEAVHGPAPAPIFHHYGNTQEKANYTTRGDGAAIDWTPGFVYMGFRYVQLTGYPGTPDYDTLTAHFVHTDYELVGDVSFSDPLLSQVQRITRTAAMSNFQSIPTDCPQRERRGWLGDAQLSAETNIYNFFMGAPYTSFVQQIYDSLDNSTGWIQDCVPYYGHGDKQADPAWGSAATFIPAWLQQYYDDDQIFGRNYPGVRMHLEGLITQAQLDNIDGLLGFSWWGDWCPPEGCRREQSHHNSALVSSYMYLKQLRMVSIAAGRLGYQSDADRYAKLAKNVSVAFNERFYNPTNFTYEETGRPDGAQFLSAQTTIALADDLGLIPSADYDKVIDTLVDDIVNRSNGHLDCGIVGIKYLLPALSRAGRNDIALLVSQTPTEPGWVYMVLQGATTLWETWTGSRYDPVASWNHIMFGSQSAWYFQHLAGIQLRPGTRGFQFIDFKPGVWTQQGSVCSKLSSTSASTVTPRGAVSASWACGVDAMCDQADEQGSITFTCGAGQTIEKVEFASFGTPAGDCSKGFSYTNCSSKNSMSVVEKLCVGKNSCTIQATNEEFGGDPCLDVRKHLAVELKDCSGSVNIFKYQVTVPVGSSADVYLPALEHDPTTVTVMEGPNTIFANNVFKPGIGGITAARVDGNNVIVTAGSGSYAFSVNA